MESVASWRLVCGAILVYYATLVFYRLCLHPLAKFPGPRLAAISRWYEAYYDVVLGGQYTSKIKELHAIHGAILTATAVTWSQNVNSARTYHPH